MRRELNLAFGPQQSLSIDLHADEPAWAAEAARRWLDERFVEYDCEPLRVSGKVLTADKVLAVTRAIGPERLQADAALRQDLARAVTAALGRPVVSIDAGSGALTY